MVLVTGGSGFVGSHLLAALREKELTVRCLARSASSGGRLLSLGVEVVRGDLRDPDSLIRAAEGTETVIHLAAINRERGKATFEAVNSQGTTNLMEAAQIAGAKRILTVIGLGADLDSPHPLARSQGLGQEAIRGGGMGYAVLQSSLIFGPGDEVFSTLAGLTKALPLVHPIAGDGRARFQPIWVGDVVACLLRALEDPSLDGQIYEIGGPEPLSFDRMVEEVLSVLGSRRARIHLSLWLVRATMAGLAPLLPKPPATPGLLAQLATDNLPTPNAAVDVFGLDLKPLRQGLDYLRSVSAGQFLRRTLGGPDFSAYVWEQMSSPEDAG